MRVPGRDSSSGPDAPLSPSPPSLPAGATALLYWGSVCLIELLLGRRIPVGPPVYVGCGLGQYSGHRGLDFYKTTADVYVARSCPFQGVGVAGANVYPAFPGCSHQATLAKVIYAADAGGEIGNCVILEHTNSTHELWIRTVYMHLATIAVAVGAFITINTPIGTVGYTGGYASTNAHLHFEILEQRTANTGWRTAAELALMTNGTTVPFRTTRPAIDPEHYLPTLEGDELIRIASPPPPAQKPPSPSPPLPTWKPYPLFPADLNYNSLVHTVEGGYGGYPTWDAAVWRPAGDSMNIYPCMDAPHGTVYVLAIGEVGSYKWVWLMHSNHSYREMITSFYMLWKGVPVTVTIDVTPGTWITPRTRIGHIDTTAPRYPFMEWTILRKKAASSIAWVPGEPIDLAEAAPYTTYESNSVHPSCYQANLDGWADWPPVGYTGCP